MPSAGDEGVVIDVWPIETQRDLAGDLIRAQFCHRLIARMGGWRLHEPQWFAGWANGEGDEDACGWQWFASPKSLDCADEDGDCIYSDHRYTCTETSLQEAVALATNIAVEGEAAGDCKAKQRRESVKVRLQDGFAPGLTALQEASPQTPATAQGQPEAAQTQLLMF